MNKKILLIVISLSLILYGCQIKKESESQKYTGFVEAKEVIIQSEIHGKILNQKVTEGQSVSKNQLLGTIENKDLNYKLNDLLLNRKIEKLTLQDLENGINKEEIYIANSKINVIEKEISSQQLKNKHLKKDLDKQKQLFQNGAISKEKLENIQNKYDLGLKKIEVLLANKKTAQNNLNKVYNYYSDETIKKQNLKIQKLDNQINELKYKIDKAKLKSPISGVLQKKYFETSEIVNINSPVYKIIDLDNKYLNVYIPHKYLKKVNLGKKISFTDEFISSKAYGIIKHISNKAEFTPQNISSKESKQELVYKTKIEIINGKSIKPGMYITIDIESDQNE